MKPLGPEWNDLEERRETLQAEQEHLLTRVPTMEPRVAGRALLTLAERMEALGAEYERRLHGGEPA